MKVGGELSIQINPFILEMHPEYQIDKSLSI